ncbi:hypothetical protein HD806DRAFT_507139 [Xylariaceae sp. AK1471]|nr:hypothetical protein HD806DRAFT_507139 [Xylariaceae sp. AK1471]
MAATTILKLPVQPLPVAGLVQPVSVTIWFTGCSIFAAAFYRLLRRRTLATWPEFKPIFIGTALLSFWYFFAVLDRWLHYDQRAVSYGYIFTMPIFEISRVASSVYYLWGNYIVVWRELEDRFPRRAQGYWWFAAKFAIFIVGLVSTFYVILYIAQSGVWVEFLSLNTIADIASKRTGFEITMTAFFFVFGLITLAAASASLLWKARTMDGGIPTNRVFLLFATLVLFVRSTFEFALTVRASGPSATRRSLQSTKDVGYGIITLLYLGLMYVTARVVSSGFDRGGKQARLVESDVRFAILKRLQRETDEGRRESPPFLTILDQVGNDLDAVLRDGPQSASSDLSLAHKQQAALSCLRKLREQYGNLDPKEGKDYGSRSASGFSSIFGRGSALGRLRNPSATSNVSLSSDMRRSSNQSMRGNFRRTSNQSMRRVTPTGQPANQGDGAPAPGPRPPSFMPSVNSMPSRWAPSVNLYPETVPEAQEIPLDRNEHPPFRERMRYGR